MRRWNRIQRKQVVSQRVWLRKSSKKDNLFRQTHLRLLQRKIRLLKFVLLLFVAPQWRRRDIWPKSGSHFAGLFELFSIYADSDIFVGHYHRFMGLEGLQNGISKNSNQSSLRKMKLNMGLFFFQRKYYYESIWEKFCSTSFGMIFHT